MEDDCEDYWGDYNGEYQDYNYYEDQEEGMDQEEYEQDGEQDEEEEFDEFGENEGDGADQGFDGEWGEGKELEDYGECGGDLEDQDCDFEEDFDEGDGDEGDEDDGDEGDEDEGDEDDEGFEGEEDWGNNYDYGENQYCEYCVEKDKVIKNLEEKVLFHDQTLTDKNNRIFRLQHVVKNLNNGEYTPRCMQGKDTYDQLNEKLEQKLGMITALKWEISVLKKNESKANISQRKTNSLLIKEREKSESYRNKVSLITNKYQLRESSNEKSLRNAEKQVKNLTQLNQQLSDQVDKVTKESKEFQELCHAKTVLLSSLKKLTPPSKPVMADGKYDYKGTFQVVLL
ncbi:unnamed protein product [Moneuplotes crassus]|uniref:Uncharacterized protein n=1 Tax=Euplotes crassus TaxID=5936 RepID=A0AAD1UMU6_EUPCR|nr:unnamed protein product [Moneuplotes crassus]